MAKKEKNRRIYEMPNGMADSLMKDPIEYIDDWWRNNATDEEKKDAEERGATASGAFAFVESVSRKWANKRKTSNRSACLPDEITYVLAGIFMRLGSDGDEFYTKEEIEDMERTEEERKYLLERRKAEAERKEAERRASLTPEQREAEDRIERERKEIQAREEQRRNEMQAIRDAARMKQERIKAIAEEMKRSQLEFNF